ncbi:MAG: PQQ-binding-like beta-propeller repeat protein [Acidobacteriota bacterium]|nr:PQQ-binding-like beta-propeller repeat protein [Acidobacteriota bacterium]
MRNRGDLFLIATFVAASALQADDWSMFAHDPAHSSFNASETQLNASNIGQLQPAWSLAVGAPIAAGVTVSDGVLYFGAWDGNFYALNATDGTVLWRQFLGVAPTPEDASCQPGIGVTSQPALVGGQIYVGGGDSALYALDKYTGNVASRTPLADPASGAYIWSSVTVSQGVLYIGLASLGDCPLVRGLLARVDPSDPTHPLIQYLSPNGEDDAGAGIWSTPAIDESTNTVYVTTGTGDQDADRGLWGGTMLALDAVTLDVQAHYFLPTNSVAGDIEWGSSPTLVHRRDGSTIVVATGKDGVLYARHAPSLTFAWTVKLAVQCISPVQGCGSISTPAFDGKTIFAGAGDSDIEDFPLGTVYALNPENGATVWKRETDGVVIAPVTVANGLVYVSTTLGLLIFDAASGDQLWEDGQLGPLYSQPVVVDGTVYSTYLTGEVVAWRLGPVPTDPLSSQARPFHRK